MCDELKKLIHNTPNLTSCNMDQICEYGECGCCFCMRTFKSSEIVEEENGTALCPHCGSPALLPGITNIEILGKIAEHYTAVYDGPKLVI